MTKIDKNIAFALITWYNKLTTASTILYYFLVFHSQLWQTSKFLTIRGTRMPTSADKAREGRCSQQPDVSNFEYCYSSSEI